MWKKLTGTWKSRFDFLRERLVFTNCSFPMDSVHQVSHYLLERQKNRVPTSLLRLGDGEGALLKWSPANVHAHYFSHLQQHLGNRINSENMLIFQELFKETLASSDLIGIRDDIINVGFQQDLMPENNEVFLHQFKEKFHLRTVEKNIDFHAALRLAGLHQFLSQYPFKSSTRFTSAWIHFELSRTGLLIQMIRNEKILGLISSRPLLAAELEKKLKIPVRFYHPPNDSPFQEGGTPHFPDAFYEILTSLKLDYPGQLFLIGAGLCGKIYGHRIKELGGIALDIGAVCDAWIGMASRTLVFRDKFNSYENSVPPELTLAYQLDHF